MVGRPVSGLLYSRVGIVLDYVALLDFSGLENVAKPNILLVLLCG